LKIYGDKAKEMSRSKINRKKTKNENGPLSFEEAISNQKAEKICAMHDYIPIMNLK